MKKNLQFILVFLLMLSFTACAADNRTPDESIEEPDQILEDEAELENDNQQPQQNIEQILFEAWPQPEESELRHFLKEKVDEFSSNILVVNDDLRDILANSDDKTIRNEPLYREWENRFLEWGYGATHFDMSMYTENADIIAELLPLCGECVTDFPDTFIASHYDTNENADKDFEELSNFLEEKFGELIDIVYVESISIGDELSGNEFVTFSLDNVYYVDDMLYTKGGEGTVFILPENQTALVLELTVTNIFEKDLTYSNTGVGSASDYIKISGKFDRTYEYNGDIYVESSYGYTVINNSFSDITPLESRTLYAVIKIPDAAKDLPAVVSIQYNGPTYEYVV